MIRLLFAAFAGLIFSGCAVSGGAKFGGFETPNADKSVLYIYRDSVFVGSSLTYHLHAFSGERSINFGKLLNGEYMKILLEPSRKYEIWGILESKSKQTKNSVVVDAKAGEIYCIKGDIAVSFAPGASKLKLVDMQTCEREIRGAKLSESR